VRSVTISSFTVPSAVRNNSAAPVVLDCAYSLSDMEKNGLVVQWFLNDLTLPVYQWIPGKRPQDIGIMKDRLNLEYRATEDPYHRHRAMQIVRPSTELGGHYFCKISTFTNEEIVSAHMVVYEPAESVSMLTEESGDWQVNVSCHVSGVYPQPQLQLVQADGPHGTRHPVANATVSMTLMDNGRYDTIIHHVFDEEDLPVNSTFECLVSLPGTEYHETHTVTYSITSPPEPTTTTISNDIYDDDYSSSETWLMLNSSSSSSSSTSLPSVSSPQRSQPDDADDVTGDDVTGDDVTGHQKRAHHVLNDDNGAGNLVNTPALLCLLLLLASIVSRPFF